MKPYVAALMNFIPGLGLYMQGYNERAFLTLISSLICLFIPLLWIFLPLCFIIPAVQSYKIAKGTFPKRS